MGSSSSSGGNNAAGIVGGIAGGLLLLVLVVLLAKRRRRKEQVVVVAAGASRDGIYEEASMGSSGSSYLSPSSAARHNYELPGEGGKHVYGAVQDAPPMYDDAHAGQDREAVYEDALAVGAQQPLYDGVREDDDEVYALAADSPPNYEVAANGSVKHQPVVYDALGQPKRTSTEYVISPDSPDYALARAETLAFEAVNDVEYETCTGDDVDEALYDNQAGASQARRPTQYERVTSDGEPIYDRPRARLSITSEGGYCFEYNDAVDEDNDVIYDRANLPRLA